MNGQAVNASNFSREAGVPRPSVDHYFSILEDTLLTHWLPAYQPGIKVRERSHPKSYWFDPGVARRFRDSSREVYRGVYRHETLRSWRG